MSDIEIVDLQKISLNISKPDVEDYKEVSQKIKKCFENIGFMYIRNHGIPQDVIDRGMESSMEFFDLKRQVKDLSRKGAEYQGWVEQGREIFDQDEEGNIAELEVRETYDLKNVSSSGIFPDENCPQLRESLARLSECSRDLALRLLRCISLCLDQDLDFMDNIHLGMLMEGTEGHVENCTTLRSIHYPPISDKMAKDPKIIRKSIVIFASIVPFTGHCFRCGEHSDYGTITLLYQDQLGGLEVKGVDGQWINADPVPGTVLVNVGDLLEALTGGLFPATRHRVVVPELEIRRRTKRQSIVFFIHPDDAVVCEPLAGPDPRYPPVTARQHLENRFAATYGDNLE